MASNSYTSANISPSSDTFREWVDLTNRITYDMEKYVVTTAPAGNTQGAETIGNAHVNGYFGANTVKIFDGIGGATGNVTHYGTNSPAANLIFHTNTVFADDGSNTSIIHAQSNVHGTNSGIQFTSNTTESAITINTTADVFQSNAGINKFNTIMDVNANVDIDNDLVTINSGNTTLGGNSTAGEFNVNSNTVFNANVHAHAEKFEVSSNSVILTANVDTFQSNATLNDINSNVDIDNALTTIDSTNTVIAAGELNITSNVNIDAASIDINDGVLKANSTAVEIDATATKFTSNATTNIFNTKIDANANVDITAANTSIANGELNVSSNLVVNSTATNANIAANVDITGTNLNTSANVAVTGANLYVTSANVNITGAGVTIGDAATDTLTVNSNTTLTDELNVQGDADFDSDVNVDGSVQVDTTLTVGNSTANAHISTEGNINTDGTLTVAGASDLNNTLAVQGATTLESTLQVQSTSEFQDDIHIGNSTVNVAIDAQTGGIDADGTLTVAGASDLNSTLAVQGATSLESTLDVTSTSQFDDKITVGNSTVNAVITAAGNIDTDGTLDVTGVTHLQSTANVDGLLRAKDGLVVTGIANASTRVGVGANVHANTTTFKVGTAGGIAKLSNNSLIIGNSTVNTSLSTTAVFTDGTLQVEGASDLNNTLAVSGISTFENTTNSTSNTTGGVVISGGLGVAKSATVGENITVHGDATIKGSVDLGDALDDTISFAGKVDTSIVPTANGTDLGTAALPWDLYGDDVRTRLLTTSSDATVGGDLDVTGYANVGFPFTVGNTTVELIKSEVNGDHRLFTIGHEVANSTQTTDRLIVKSRVGNSSIGIIPLAGNNVPFGASANRWGTIYGVDGEFSGTVNIDDTTESTSTSTGSLIVDGGVGVAKKVFTGSDLVVAGTANVAGDLNVTTNMDVTGTSQFASAITVGNSTVNAVVSAAGNIDTDGTLTVAGTTNLNGDINLGNANSDSVNFTAEVSSGIIPEANTQALGLDDARWILKANTINASGDITASADIDGSGQTNTNTLRVRSTSAFEGDVTVGNTSVYVKVDEDQGDLTATGNVTSGNFITSGDSNTNTLHATGTVTLDAASVNFGNSSIYANVTSNTSQVKIESGKLQAADIEITNSAILPSNTTLTSTSLGTANLTVTNFAEFTGGSTAGGANNSIKIGDGNARVIINFANAAANADFISDDTSRNIGKSGARWGTAYLATKAEIGSNVYANTTGFNAHDRFIVTSNSTIANVTADNIFARDELVGASSSDRELKDNLLVIDTASDKIKQISGYEFEWNSNIGDDRIGKRDYGVIAQEVEKILPQAVNINSRGYKTVNYNSLIPLLVEAVKELSGKVEELERQNKRKEDLGEEDDG